MILEGQTCEPTPADLALDTWLTARDHLQKILEDGGLAGYSNPERVCFLQSFEQGRNKMALLDHVLINDCVAHDLPGELCQSSMNRVLTQALRISAAEASRRVQAAERLGDRVSVTGQRLGPVRPVLAAAQRAGTVTPEQVHIIHQALGAVERPGFDQADITIGEEILTRAAAEVGPKDLAGLADRVVEAINPDGTLPRDELNRDRRSFHLRATRDGGYTGEFRLTASLGAKLEAVLGPLTKPRTGTLTHPDGTTPRWIRGRSGSAGTTRSKTSATGCSGPTPCPTPGAPRRR